jgi:dTMP kinase
MFITLEGPDKAGKTTQIKMLKEYAEKHHPDWLFTRNPGGTDLGNGLRKIVLDTEEIISDKAELMIYLADRAHHIDYFIRPALKEGKTVICDRFIDSTVVYQGYGRGIDISIIELMNNFVCGGIKPDLTIMLMVSDKVASERTKNETDRLEQENKLFFVRIRNGYNSVAKREPTRIRVINTDNATVEEIHDQIIDLIETHVNRVKA